MNVLFPFFSMIESDGDFDGVLGSVKIVHISNI